MNAFMDTAPGRRVLLRPKLTPGLPGSFAPSAVPVGGLSFCILHDQS